jgi:hypothetical protein
MKYFPSMPPQKKKIALAVIGTLSLVALWAGISGIGVLAQERMQKFLARHGIGEAVIASFGHGSGGQAIFSDIRLDPDGFSTIDSITARVRWASLPTSDNPFSEIIVGRMTLTGEIDKAGNLTFAGLTPAALLPLGGTDNLILDAGQIDLSTPIGALQFETKFRMTRQPDNSQKIEAALWSKQFRMEMDTRWNGQILPDGKWKLSSELREARLNLEHLNFSRANGWLSVEGASLVASSVAGQIEAGQLRLGKKTAFSNVRATIEGPYDSSHIILHANVSAYKDMVVTADLRRSGGSWQVRASVDAKKADDILAFLYHLHSDLELAAPRSSILTTLLITPGNLDRIQAQAKKVTHDSVELVINGSAGNLKGEIILRWNGNMQTGAISMNPA